MASFPYKKLLKYTFNLSNPYVHSMYTLLLIKEIFEKNKSLRAASKCQMNFWLRITPDDSVPYLTESNLCLFRKLLPSKL